MARLAKESYVTVGQSDSRIATEDFVAAQFGLAAPNNDRLATEAYVDANRPASGLLDDFSSDTLADYTAALGSKSNWSIGSGLLTGTEANGVIYNTLLSAADIRAGVPCLTGDNADKGVSIVVPGPNASTALGLLYRNPRTYNGHTLYFFDSAGNFGQLDNPGPVSAFGYMEIEKVGNIVTYRTFTDSTRASLVQEFTYDMSGNSALANNLGAGKVGYGGVRSATSPSTFDELRVDPVA